MSGKPEAAGGPTGGANSHEQPERRRAEGRWGESGKSRACKDGARRGKSIIQGWGGGPRLSRSTRLGGELLRRPCQQESCITCGCFLGGRNLHFVDREQPENDKPWICVSVHNHFVIVLGAAGAHPGHRLALGATHPQLVPREAAAELRSARHGVSGRVRLLDG